MTFRHRENLLPVFCGYNLGFQETCRGNPSRKRPHLQEMWTRERIFPPSKYTCQLPLHAILRGRTCGSIPCHIMKGTCCKLSVSKPPTSSRDLPTMLDSLCVTPFEPLAQTHLKMVTLNIALLLLSFASG